MGFWKKTACFAGMAAAAVSLLSSCATKEPPRQADTELLKAVRRDDSDAVAKLLSSKDSGLNTADLLGRTPLMIASGEGRNALVASLLSAGAYAGAKDVKGQTALHFAASSGDAATVKTLLDAGSDSSAKDSYGWTPLTEACRLGNYGAVKALLEAGADVDSQDREGKTPLIHAAASKRNSPEIVKLLVDRGSDLRLEDREGLSALMWAIRGGNSDSALIILSAIPSLSGEREFGLLSMQWAIKAGDLKMVEVLVEKGVPLNLETSDFTNVAKKLQAKGIAKVFANYGLLAENRTPLMWAAIFGQPRIAAFLIAKGSDVKARDNKGNTALDYAKDYATSKVIRSAGGR